MNFTLSETQQLQWNSVVEFAKRELNEGVRDDDRSGIFPQKKWAKCAEMGLLSLLTAEEYGGLAEDLLSTAISIQALSYGCEDSGLVHAVITQLCCIVMLGRYGTPEQKQKYLPRLSTGEIVAAQAITEPDAGSDFLSLRTRIDAGGPVHLLSGAKVFTSNGPLADLIIVFAKSTEKKSAFGDVSCVLVEKDTSGYSTGKALEKMGLRTLQNSELFFDDAPVPPEMLLGKEGHGLFIFNECIEWERTLMAATHLGTLERVLERSIAYVKARKQFGQEIGKNQAVSHKISEMKLGLELGKLILYKTAWLKDQGKRAALEASLAKLFVSERLKSCCLDAVQIHGGYGYMQEYDLERDLRDSIAATIYSGTSEIQKNIISRMLGL